MKLTSVELHPAGSSDFAVLSFRDPSRSNPYNVRVIEGLGAEEITPRYYGGPGGSTKFHNLALGPRVVVVRIDLNPRFHLNETYSSLRDALYKHIASSRTGSLQIQFKNSVNVVAALTGFINKVEPDLFTKEQGVQLTINCSDSMLKALVPTELVVGPLDPALTVITDAFSTAPHGFTFELAFTGVRPSLIITDPGDPTWSFTVTPSGGFLVGDILHFSSEFNNKYLYIERGVSTIHLADVISSDSVWPILFPGENNLSLSGAASLDWNAISYYPTYWGV